MDVMQKIVDYLDDPYVVAKFQTLCGLTLNTEENNINNTDKASNDDAIYGVCGLSNPSFYFRDKDDPRMTSYEDQNEEIIQPQNPDEKEFDNDDDDGGVTLTKRKKENKPDSSNGSNNLNKNCNNISSDVNCIQRTNVQTKDSNKIKNEVTSDNSPVKTLQNGNIPSVSSSSCPSKTTPVKNTRVQCRLPYKINNKPLYYLFSFGAGLGNELFYTTCFPYILWNVDAFISRKIVIIWWIILYIGQATKDILKRPRPISPPVIKLEARYELEYGMPSTHAMVGTCIPLTALFIAWSRYEFPFSVGLLLAVSWILLVSLSRIYLGMHSILDVVVGILYSCLSLPFLFPFLQDFDQFSVTHPLAPVITISVPFVLCLCYPPVDKWSTARRDTTLLVGVAAGISVGSWLSYQYGLAVESPPTPYQIHLPSLADLAFSLARMVVGVPLMLLTGELLRPVLKAIMIHILKLDIRDPKIKKMQAYELTDGFIPFLIVAANVTFGIPMVFKFLHIDRPEYYTELLIPNTA